MTTYSLLPIPWEYECGCQFTEGYLRKVYQIPNDWPLPEACPDHGAPLNIDNDQQEIRGL